MGATIPGCYLSVDRLIRSVEVTLDVLDLPELCPRLVPAGAVAPPADDEAVVGRWWCPVRGHAAVDPGGRPLRRSAAPSARLLAVAAGAGPVVVSDRRVTGTLPATAGRPALAYELAWDEVDDVGPAASGGVRLLSTRLLGALTLDPVRSVHGTARPGALPFGQNT